MGDDLMPYFLRTLAGKEGKQVGRSQPHILGPCSLLAEANELSFVWGSGYLNETSEIASTPPSQIRALRGELSLQKHEQAGFKLEEVVLGDPGIFASDVLSKMTSYKGEKIFEFALVPHHGTIHWDFVQEIRRLPHVVVVEPFDNSLNSILAIAQSKKVISQSLHGLIFAESFGVPATWITTTMDPNWLFKFKDWFSTTKNKAMQPMLFEGNDLLAKIQLALDGASLQNSAIDKTALAAALPNDALLLSDKSLLNFQICRSLTPRVVVCEWLPKSISLFENLSDTLLTSLSASIRSMLTNEFRLWSERVYCILLPAHFKAHLGPAQYSALTNIFDQASTVDWFCLHDIGANVPPEKTHFLNGVHILEQKVFGGAICVRPDFTELNSNFMALSL